MADDVAAGGANLSPTPSHPAASSNSSLDASSFTYTPFYCEENVYLLCKELIKSGIADPAGSDLYAVFISNEKKKVPLWYQKASHTDDGFVLWDYHVICIQIVGRYCDDVAFSHIIVTLRNKGEIIDLVWDLDSSLPFPCPFLQYVSDSIRPLSFDSSNYRRLFRVVHGPVFLRSFASDRSHMKDPMGNWIEFPPKYEPIMAEDGNTNNLNGYIVMSMDDVRDLESMINDVYSNKHGVVINETLLPKLFSRFPE